MSGQPGGQVGEGGRNEVTKWTWNRFKETLDRTEQNPWETWAYSHESPDFPDVRLSVQNAVQERDC